MMYYYNDFELDEAFELLNSRLILVSSSLK